MAGNASEIRRGIYLKVRDEFNHNNVVGLSANPPITQRATHKLEDPFIYIWSESQLEVNKTKDDESYQYAIRVEVSTKANSNQGGQLQSDQMAAEIYRIFDVPTSEYPDITDKGYDIYIVEFDETASFVEEVRGGTYFRKVITILVTARYVGFDGSTIPVQLTSYAFNDWMYPPSVRELERYDSGTIIPQTTYPNLTSGWDFVNSVFTIGTGAQGSFTNDIYTLASTDEPVALDSTLNYVRDIPDGGGTVLNNVLVPGSGVRYRDSLTTGDWRIIGTGFGLFTIADGFAWSDITSSIIRIQIAGDYSQTTIVTGDLIRITVASGSWVEYTGTIVGNSTSLTISDVVFQASNGTISGISANNTPNQIQLDEIVVTPTEENYALMATTQWDRIGSLRYGVIASSSQPIFTDDTSVSTGIRDLSNFQSTDDTISFGTVDPTGSTITFNGVEGEWMYIIIDASQDNLTGLIDAFNENNLDSFEDPVIVGEYKAYVQKRPLSYTNTLTFTIE